MTNNKTNTNITINHNNTLYTITRLHCTPYKPNICLNPITCLNSSLIWLSITIDWRTKEFLNLLSLDFGTLKHLFEGKILYSPYSTWNGSDKIPQANLSIHFFQVVIKPSSRGWPTTLDQIRISLNNLVFSFTERQLHHALAQYCITLWITVV